MFGWFKRKPAASVAASARAPTAEPAPAAEAAAPAYSGQSFVADEPIAGAAQDRFRRAPFATRVADTIAKRGEASSLVIGIFGPWGDGKTSVLQMMDERLNRYEDVIVVRFNPWHFPSEEQLLRGFFSTLADALGKRLPNFKERAGELLKDYGSLLSVASLTFGGMVQFKPGDAARGVGEAMSNVSLNELKDRIERLLDESGKRMVIMVDDIDRLDRAETHSIFKLVKLSASFRHTAYVLAFDDEVVAAALGERYGAGGHQAGRAFLEKIVQVPLHLPPADEISLRMIAFDGVEAALKQAEIDLPQPAIDAFVRRFVDGLEPKLATPRMAKIYTNALMFALPLLKGEANIVDLMLMEGIRILYPGLYVAIRDNPDVFLKSDRENRMNGLDRAPRRLDQLLEESMPGAPAEEREQVRDRLLSGLFPRTTNMGYGHEWDEIWGRDQKICVSGYFRRYFVYSVPDGDISDGDIRAFVGAFARGEPADSRQRLESFVARRNMSGLIGALRRRADEFDPHTAAGIGRAIVRNADLVPVERGPMVLGGSTTQAGILISQLLKQVPAGPQRRDEAETLMRVAEPLPFAIECLRWIRHSDERPEYRLLEDDGEGSLLALIVERIAAAHEASPAYIQFPDSAQRIYWTWRKHVGGELLGDLLRERFGTDPAEVDQFLDTYVGEAWELQTGLPVRSSFERQHYDDVASLVGAEYVYDNLRERYGAQLTDPQRYGDSSWSNARKIAHQFAYIHQHVATDLERPLEHQA